MYTQAVLREHFGQFGDLDDVALMRNKHTGQPRGFGFVKFKEAACEYTGRGLGSHITRSDTAATGDVLHSFAMSLSLSLPIYVPSLRSCPK